MALILKSMFSYYNYIFYTLKGLFDPNWAFNSRPLPLSLPNLFTDPRSSSFILIQDSPLFVLSILAAYSLFCNFGPLLMKSKQPLELKQLMILYNLVQASSCAYFATKVSFGVFVNFKTIKNSHNNNHQWKNFAESICKLFQAFHILLWKYEYNYSCQPVDYSSSEHGMTEVTLCYIYLLLKILDLFDTVWLVFQLYAHNNLLSFIISSRVQIIQKFLSPLRSS